MPSFLCSPGMDSLTPHLPPCLLPCSLWNQGAIDSSGLPGVPAPCKSCLLAQCLNFKIKTALTIALLSWPMCPLFYALEQYFPRRAWWAVRVLSCPPTFDLLRQEQGGCKCRPVTPTQPGSGKWGHPVSSLGTHAHSELKCICVLVTLPFCE